MKETKIIDAKEVYEQRGYIHKTYNSQTSVGDYHIAKKLKKEGKEIEEIALSLNLTNDTVFKLLKG